MLMSMLTACVRNDCDVIRVADLKSASGKVHGKIHVEAEEHSGMKGNINMQARGTGLDKKDFFGT